MLFSRLIYTVFNFLTHDHIFICFANCFFFICSINEKAAMLSNYEVYQLLQETEIKNKVGQTKIKKPKHLVNLSTICYEVSIFGATAEEYCSLAVFSRLEKPITRTQKIIPPWMVCNISSSIAISGWAILGEMKTRSFIEGFLVSQKWTLSNCQIFCG